MESTISVTPGLYQQILGDQWHRLAEIVRRLHTSGASIHATGTFRVTRGTNRLARALAWLARLPSETDAVAVQLKVSPTATREEWHRVFGARPLASVQWFHGGNLLEHMGLSETRMALDVVDGALHYRTEACAFRLGFLRVPLPRWLTPRITACEKADGDHVLISVEVCLPMLGRLIGYEGRLTAIEVKPC